MTPHTYKKRHGEIAQILTDLRLEAGLSFGRFAKQSGFSSGMLNSWECGRTTPTMKMLVPVLEFYGYEFEIISKEPI